MGVGIVRREAVATAQGAALKAALLADGVRLAPEAEVLVAAQGKPPLRVRSGSCGGLDVRLPDGTHVNCPVAEPFAQTSPYLLDADGEDADGGRLVLRYAHDGRPAVPVDVLPRPAYYGQAAPSGVPLERVGQICSDRLGIGLTNGCRFWADRSARCRFCSIGLNGGRRGAEEVTKSVDDVLAVTEAALADPVLPARHVMLGGGTPEGPDAGAVRMAEIAAALRHRWPVPLYAMLAPPADLAYLELLREAGVNEVALNIELFDAASSERHLPGKHRQIGMAAYLAALRRAVELFGPVNTRSIMIVGLEPPESTLEGVHVLASMGVMPILTPFRPMAGTMLEGHPRFDAATLWRIACEAAEIAAAFDMPLGPTCVPCQANTLNPPDHPCYRYY